MKNKNKNINIVYFHQEKIKHYIRKYERTGYLSDFLIPYYDDKIVVNSNKRLADVTRTISRKQDIFNKNQFDFELEKLMNSFSTESSKFMFPTVLIKYRKGMNPVKALYNEVQRVLFQYSKHNKEHVWIVSLFDDQQWFNSLISALDIDIEKIHEFQKKWKKYNNNEIKETVHFLYNVTENLNHFKEVFLLIHSHNKEILK